MTVYLGIAVASIWLAPALGMWATRNATVGWAWLFSGVTTETIVKIYGGGC
jgi:hypothetical protein